MATGGYPENKPIAFHWPEPPCVRPSAPPPVGASVDHQVEQFQFTGHSGKGTVGEGEGGRVVPHHLFQPGVAHQRSFQQPPVEFHQRLFPGVVKSNFVGMAHQQALPCFVGRPEAVFRLVAQFMEEPEGIGDVMFPDEEVEVARPPVGGIAIEAVRQHRTFQGDQGNLCRLKGVGDPDEFPGLFHGPELLPHLFGHRPLSQQRVDLSG